MSDKVEKFEITSKNISGQHGAQVHVIDRDDLDYWNKQAIDNNYIMIYSYSLEPEHYMNHYGVWLDVYQILPKSFLIGVKP